MAARPFLLAVKAVIVDDARRCLLLRRSAANRNFIGAWEWPGGKVDPGEDFATAVRRETREESGLEVELTGLAGATSFDMPQGAIIVLCLETRLVSGQVRLSHEHDAFDWVPLAALPRYPLVPRVGDFMLDYARRRLAAG